MIETLPQRSPQRYSFFLILLTTSYLLVAAAMVIPLFMALLMPAVEVGQVATLDIQAPRSLTYQSKLLTDRQREMASANVVPIFSTPDTSIARHQLEQLRATLAFISTVRLDTQATQQQRLNDLYSLQTMSMSTELANQILALNDLRWKAIQQEAIVVLEQVMRTPIRQDHQDEMRHSLPSMVSLALTEDQADIVVSIVEPFVVANSIFSEELTNAARQAAAEAIQPVVRTYQAGETIVQRGRVLKPEDIEVLQSLGLIQPQADWKKVLGSISFACLVTSFLFIYLRRKKSLSSDIRVVTLLVSLFIIFLLAARLLPTGTLFPYLFPFAAFGMVVSVMIGSSDIAIIASICLALLCAYGLPNVLEISLFYVASSLFGVLTLGRGRRIMSFLLAGLASAAAGAIILIILSWTEAGVDPYSIASTTAAAFLGGIASAGLAILLQFILAQYLGMATALHLMEISRPDHPLLHYLLTNAPGTYQHSLQVANLAEQAAERIGADTLLTRVGALYHDIGKAANPVFFIENQVANSPNPHDGLDPVVSAKTIIEHIHRGLKLGRKYRLPNRILDFISEHHGTMIARYQYAKAIKEAGGKPSQVEVEKFQYPGPKPRSRETAILMLADGCEARVRAERPKDENELREVIKSVFDDRIASGQLGDTNLTLNDLTLLMEAFTSTLRGIYHPRIEYPKMKPSPGAETPLEPDESSPMPGGQSVTQPVQKISKPHPEKPV